ncbi:glycoside hydrolase family 43 protein [soil metagenome]
MAILGASAVTLVAAPEPATAYPGAPWFEPGQRYDDNFADPSIVRDGDTYYAYGTSTGGAYLPVMTSTDLRTWTARPAYAQPSCVGGRADPFFNDALPCPASWAPDRPVGGRLTKEVWAPGAARIGSQWVVFYSVKTRLDPERFCISVATSRSPLGPFVDSSAGPLVCDNDPKGSIDPQPFVDDDGTPYLIWKSEGFPCPRCEPTRSWSRRLAPSGTSFAPGSAKVALLSTNHPKPNTWEGTVIENPAMVRWAGRLYLFYSANEWDTAAYATGYAECASPVAPCAKRTTSTPLLANRGAVLGP